MMVAKKTTKKKPVRASRKAAVPSPSKEGEVVHATDRTFGSVVSRSPLPVLVDVGFATKTKTATWLRRALARKPEPKRVRRPVCCGR